MHVRNRAEGANQIKCVFNCIKGNESNQKSQFYCQCHSITNGNYNKLFAPIAAVAHTHDTRNRLMETAQMPRTASAADTLRYYLPQFLETVPRAIKDKVNTHSFKGFTHYVKIFYINSA